MGFKREEIFGTTPLDIKKINDNTKNLWLKVFGNIDFTDFTTKMQNTITSKVNSGDMSSIIQQSSEDIRIGFNGITDNVVITSSGITVNYGSFTAPTINGATINGGTITGNNVNVNSLLNLSNAFSIYSSAIQFNTSSGTTFLAGYNTSGNNYLTTDGGLIANVISYFRGGISTNNVNNYGYADLGDTYVNGNLSVSGDISGSTINIQNPPWAVLNHTHTYFGSSLSFGSVNGDFNATYLGSTGNIAAQGSLTVSGAKNCVQQTTNYGKRLINAYETAEYYFGDIGRGTVSNGECVITLESIFSECVNTDIQYEVFLSKYGQGDIWVDTNTMTNNSFTVKGDNISFAWEIKAKRKGYENNRLEQFVPEGGI